MPCAGAAPVGLQYRQRGAYGYSVVWPARLVDVIFPRMEGACSLKYNTYTAVHTQRAVKTPFCQYICFAVL